MDTLETTALQLADRAGKVIVRDQASYVEAVAHRKEIKALVATIKGSFRPIIDKAHKAWKEALAQEARYIKPLEALDAKLRDAGEAYQREAEARAEAARREAEAAARKAQEDRMLAEAAAAEAAGDHKEAAVILDTPVETPVVHVQPAVPKVEDVSFREYWTFEIVDEKAIPREFLMPDEDKIGAIVKGLKGETKIPGIRAYSKKTQVLR